MTYWCLTEMVHISSLEILKLTKSFYEEMNNKDRQNECLSQLNNHTFYCAACWHNDICNEFTMNILTCVESMFVPVQYLSYIWDHLLPKTIFHSLLIYFNVFTVYIIIRAYHIICENASIQHNGTLIFLINKHNSFYWP